LRNILKWTLKCLCSGTGDNSPFHTRKSGRPTASGSGSSRIDAAHGTHASFGARGDRVVVTYHGDHAYSFDVTAAGGDPVVVYGSSAASPGVQGSVASRHRTRELAAFAIGPVCIHLPSRKQTQLADVSDAVDTSCSG
jgi:hypothetical protein